MISCRIQAGAAALGLARRIVGRAALGLAAGCAFAFALAPSAVRAQGTTLPAIVVPASASTIAVAVESPAPELRLLGRIAFNAHGRFRVVDTAAAASYVVRFAPAGPGAVAVSILRGTEVVYSGTGTGSTDRQALLAAADTAVTRITGLRGFFAGRLTFTVDRGAAREVYTSDLFLGELLQLTSDRSQAVSPRWAPDGRRIVYTSYHQTGFPDLFIIDLEERRRTPFVQLRGTNTAAAFSPDGTRVAMSLSGEGNPELYVANANGRGIRRLTRNTWVDTSPAWSPDGTRLVYASAPGGRPQLHVLPAAGGEPRRLATDISGYCAEPDWNPVDASLIAFTAAQGGGFQVAVHDLTGTGSRFVTKVAGDAVEPVWLADGRHLVCTERQVGQRRLVIVDTESGKTVALSAHSFGLVAEADYLPPRR